MILPVILVIIVLLCVLALVIELFVQDSSHTRAIENREADRTRAAIDNLYTHAEEVVRWQSRNQS